MNQFAKFIIKTICGYEHVTYTKIIDELLQLIRVYGQEGVTAVYSRKVILILQKKVERNVFFKSLTEFQRMKNLHTENDAFYCIYLLLPVLQREVINVELATIDRIRAAHTRCQSYLGYKVKE